MERSFLPRVLSCSHLHPNQGKSKVKHIITWVYHSAQKNQVSGANVPSVLSPRGCTGTHTEQSGSSLTQFPSSRFPGSLMVRVREE